MRQTTFRWRLCWVVGITLHVMLMISCQVRKDQPVSTPFTDSETGGLSPNEIATLNSLERVDDYPLYTMHYTGDYSSGFSNFPTNGIDTIWSCSLFTAFGNENNKLYGRNFDWQYSPAMLLFTDSPNSYASVSMVDIAYLGFQDKTINLVDLPLVERQALLQAPYLPFDGMNEYGLAIGMAAVPESLMPYDPNKPTLDSLAVIREILDHARTVSEAVGILEKYNIEWGSGPAMHYLIADSTGKSVLVEFYDGNMVPITNISPWHLATNHLRVNAQGDGGCERYNLLEERITSSEGKLTLPDAMQLLNDVSQVGDYPTQWSIVYGISTGEIDIVMGRDFEVRHTFQLPLAGK